MAFSIVSDDFSESGAIKDEREVVLGFATFLFVFQMVDDKFDMKDKIQDVLKEKDFAKKRARTMDIDDFLG